MILLPCKNLLAAWQMYSHFRQTQKKGRSTELPFFSIMLVLQHHFANIRQQLTKVGKEATGIATIDSSVIV